MKNQKAFTLIELLVVVLIIGILAAVAVPQYQAAVQKSRFATYRTLANSIAKAVVSYHLANGSWPNSFDVLDVDLPAGMTITQGLNGQCGHTDNLFCCLSKPVPSSTYGSIACGDNAHYSLIYRYIFALDNGTLFNRASCQVKPAQTKICKSLGARTWNNSNTKFVTPNAIIKSGYDEYYF